MTEALTEDELTFLRSMFDLARAGDTAQLGDAVDAGVPVNLTNEAGDSLLMLAAYHDHPDMVRALLDRGADTARINDRGQTALGAAVFRRSERGVTHLLAAGADPTLGPRSACDIAEFFDLPTMLTLLSQRDDTKGPPMSTPDIDPDTASSMLEDADFADEHTKPTHSDEPAPEGPDESVPSGDGGEGGMDIHQNKLSE